MSKPDYQAIVLGAGVGGLSCAGLLARRGLKVIVLEPGERPGGCNGTIDQQGFQFGLGTSEAWGFSEGDPIEHMLSELGCLDDLLRNQRLLHRLDLPLQVILPSHRLNVYAQRSRLFLEIEREFEDDLAALQTFYGTLDALAKLMDDLHAGYPFAGFPAPGIRTSLLKSTLSGAVKDCQRELEHIFDGRSIRAETRGFLAAQARFFGAISFRPEAILQLASLYRLPERGIYTFRGAGRGLASFLAEQVRAYGSSVIYRAEVESLLLKGSRAIGVKARLEGSPVTLSADAVVANLGYEFLLTNLLSEPRTLTRLKKKFGQARRSWVSASLLLGVDQSVIPEPLANQAVLIADETQAAEGENLILLSVNPVWDDSRAPAGKRALTVTTYLPGTLDGLEALPRVDNAFAPRLLKRLERIAPFLSTSVDVQEILQPTNYVRCVFRPADDLVRLDGLPQRLGMSGLPLHLGIKNLFFIGVDSFLGPTAAGSVMSGWMAAEAITS